VSFNFSKALFNLFWAWWLGYTLPEKVTFKSPIMQNGFSEVSFSKSKSWFSRSLLKRSPIPPKTPMIVA
jgi:hypothetical protein